MSDLATEVPAPAGAAAPIDRAGRHPVVGVMSGCGGAGGSTFAAVLAGCLGAGREAPVLLLDCDPLGGGIDVLLGCEQSPGPRWSQVRLSGGSLPAATLHGELPHWGAVSVLAADTAHACDPAALEQLITVGSSAGPVVLDLPRWPGAVQRAALRRCDLIVLITPAEIRSVTSATLVARGLDPLTAVLAVRGSSRTLSLARIAAAVGLSVVGELPYDPAGLHAGGLQLHRTRRGTRRVADDVIALLRAAATSAP